MSFKKNNKKTENNKQKKNNSCLGQIERHRHYSYPVSNELSGWQGWAAHIILDLPTFCIALAILIHTEERRPQVNLQLDHIPHSTTNIINIKYATFGINLARHLLETQRATERR